ncbi:lipopolysaccharide biosynthesis protein [Cyanosarcina cf. burmensis CCALA 770]|nr:lipopolysaccharide biosynthesis protein [Cyanosarcina cf. burmensis CCALA 770]
MGNYTKNRNKEDNHNEIERTGNIVSDLRDYWCMLKRRWLPAVVVLGSVVTLSAIYTYGKESIYSAQGQLLFEPEDKASSLIGLGSTQGSKPTASGWSDVDRILDTEMRVILSSPVLQQTLDVLAQTDVKARPTSIGELWEGLAIKKAVGTNILTISYQSTDPETAALVVNQLMSTYRNNKLLASRATATEARKFVSAQLPKVEASVAASNAALRSFKERNKVPNLEATKNSLAANLEKIQSQLDSVQTQIADLNSQSADIQKKMGMNPQSAIAISTLSQSPAVQGTLADLQDIQRKLATARSNYQESHPSVVNLKTREAQLNNLLQEQIAKIAPNQKELPYSKLQLGKINETLAANLISDLLQKEAARTGLTKQVATLEKQKAFYLKQSAELPRLEQQQRELEQRKLASESTYEALLKSLQEIGIQENRTLSNVRIIDPAPVPQIAIAPNSASTMVAGGLGGILLAGAVVFLLEATDKKIRTVQEVRDLFEYTLLGTIPVFNETTTNVVSANQPFEQGLLQLPAIEQPHSPISESYRRLQTNLKFLDSEKALKVIVVTSSVPKEGKSTTCVNLAASMTQLGYKVLIIDADMHYPVQQQFWKISSVEGLSNIIAEQIHLKTNVFHRVMENLDVVTSGDLAPNPLALINSQRMATFIQECSNNYDYVFIDTPPLLASAADAAHLGRIADGVLIVTRPEITDSTSSRFVKEYLNQSGQNILGLVVNGVLPKNEPDNSLLSYYTPGNNSRSSDNWNWLAISKPRNWIDNFRFIKRSR